MTFLVLWYYSKGVYVATDFVDTVSKFMVDRGPQFDFAAAVDEARRDFPAETKKITFVDLSAPDADQQIYSWLNKIDPGFKQFTLCDKPAEGYIDFCKTKDGFGTSDPVTGESILCVHPGKSGVDPVLGSGTNPKKEGQYCFDHELGHILCKDGMPDHRKTFPYAEVTQEKAIEEVNRGERGADAFGYLRGLKRGSLDMADVVNAGKLRAMEVCRGLDIVHGTSHVSDTIAGLEKKTDFKAYSARELLGMAEGIVAKTEVKADTAHHSFANLNAQRMTAHDWLVELSDVCLRAPDKSLEFVASAKVLNEVFKTGQLEGQAMNTVDPYWDHVRHRLFNGAANLGMEKTLADFAFQNVKSAPAAAPQTAVMSAPKQTAKGMTI